MPSATRKRKIAFRWPRDPTGTLLPKPGPRGVRPPNAIIWGHTPRDLFWIERIPGVALHTIWSRSMIKEFGENYDSDGFERREPRPRVRRPWPVLKVPRDMEDEFDPPLGAVDEGSDNEHARDECADDDSDDDSGRRWLMRRDEDDPGCEDEDGDDARGWSALGYKESEMQVIAEMYIRFPDGQILHRVVYRPPRRGKGKGKGKGRGRGKGRGKGKAVDSSRHDKGGEDENDEEPPFIPRPINIIDLQDLVKEKRTWDAEPDLPHRWMRPPRPDVYDIDDDEEMQGAGAAPDNATQDNIQKRDAAPAPPLGWMRPPGPDVYDIDEDEEMQGVGAAPDNATQDNIQTRDAAPASPPRWMRSRSPGSDVYDFDEDEKMQGPGAAPDNATQDNIQKRDAAPAPPPGWMRPPGPDVYDIDEDEEMQGAGAAPDNATQDNTQTTPRPSADPSAAEDVVMQDLTMPPVSLSENTERRQADPAAVTKDSGMAAMDQAQDPDMAMKEDSADQRPLLYGRECILDLDGASTAGTILDGAIGADAIRGVTMTMAGHSRPDPEGDPLLGKDAQQGGEMLAAEPIKEADAKSKKGKEKATGLETEANADEMVTRDEDQVASNAQNPATVASAYKFPWYDPDIVKEIPKLEEFIPEQYFPDVLTVYHEGQGMEGQQYQRIFPKLDASDRPTRTAKLWLPGFWGLLGQGHHSLVHRAALELPPPLTAYGKHGKVTVAAKTAFGVVSARKLLRNEASVLAQLPRHMMQEWCGYNIVKPICHPVPVGAIVPKLYGYYVPVGTDGRAMDYAYAKCDDDDKTRVSTPSPILLMEECGEPVKPILFSLDDRSECWSLVMRLHLENVIQGSMYTRNILWQPGPLTKPPEKRSLATPSFRLIDFGRAERWDDFVGDRKDKKNLEWKSNEWHCMVEAEQQRARRELLIPDFDC